MPDAPLGPYAPAEATQVNAIDGGRIDYDILLGVCDKDPRPLVWESDRLVVLGGTATTMGGNCVAMGVSKRVTATLSRPVGDRIIVDVASGQAVRLPGTLR